MNEAPPRVRTLAPSRDPLERELFRNMTTHVLGLQTEMDWGYVPTLQSTIPYPPLPRLYECKRDKGAYHRWLECSCPRPLTEAAQRERT